MAEKTHKEGSSKPNHAMRVTVKTRLATTTAGVEPWWVLPYQENPSTTISLPSTEG
jgi:hypothetical protein